MMSTFTQSLFNLYTYLTTTLSHYTFVLAHSLHLHPTSSTWPLSVALTVRQMREWSDPSPPQSISEMQADTLQDPGIKGAKWISKVTIPRPEDDDVRRALLRVIDGLKEGEEEYAIPDLANVEAEWTGYRSDVGDTAPRPDLSEEVQFERLMEETSSDATILYFHGGGYNMCDPCSHRRPCAHLAQLTAGRVFSVRYRLAPQHPFPSALLDALLAYLYLLSAPSNSFHAPVSAHNIVFAGDSAGGGLALALLQFILELRRQSVGRGMPSIRVWGKDVELPLPAGVAVMAPGVDISRSSVSLRKNMAWDFLPVPERDIGAHLPVCGNWPSKPPRGDMYCETSMLCHPLVSPLAAMKWEGAPPAFFLVGSKEMLVDEGRALAKRMDLQGVKVRWVEGEGGFHCWPMVMPGLGLSKVGMEEWGTFVVEVFEKRVGRSEGWRWNFKGKKKIEISVGGKGGLEDEEVLRRMRKARGERRDIG